MMNKDEEYYCPPEIIDAFFEDFPFSSQDAEIRNKCSEINEVKLESNLRGNSMDFNCSLPRVCDSSQSRKSCLSDEMETDVSKDHQLPYKETILFTKKPTTFQSNDSVISNTSIRCISDVTKNIIYKYVHLVPLYAENKNSSFTTVTSETVEDQNNIKFSMFYLKRNRDKLVTKQINNMLHSSSISVGKSVENRHKYSTFMPNKGKQTKKLNVKSITWKDPHYSHNKCYLANDQFINTNSFLSLLAKGAPIVLKESINAIPVCGKLKLIVDIPFLYLDNHSSVVAYNNIKYENTLEQKLAKFQLRDDHSLNTDTCTTMNDSDTHTQKYHTCSTKNDLSTSAIKIQKNGEKCMKCSHKKGSNDFEATVEYKPERKLYNLDKRQKELTFLSIPTIYPKNNKKLHNFPEAILQAFENTFQRSKINFCNEISMINGTQNTINTSNFNHHRINADKKVVDVRNKNSHKIFASSPEYITLQHDLYSSSSDYSVISSPMDPDNYFSKTSQVKQISCGITSTEVDPVVDHDLINFIDKEVDLSFEQHGKNSLQLADKTSPKEVECQTDLSLNCNKIYEYQHSDSCITLNLSDTFQLPGPYNKRKKLEVSVHNATPPKRQCSTDVSEYQEADIVKWKIERYLSSNADEANQIVPSNSVDEDKYEFNSMELYGEVEAVKDKKDISAYKVFTYNSNEINSVASTNENTSSHKSLNYINNRRPLRLGLSRRANTKRLHSYVVGHH